MSEEIKSQKTMRFKAGDMLFSEGDYADFFYIIQSGNVDVFRVKGGKKIPLAMVKKGQVLGEFSVIDGEPRSAHAKALTDVEALKISAQVLKEQIGSNPEWFSSLIISLVTRTRKMNEIFKRHIIGHTEASEEMQKAKFDEAKGDI